jgi:nicotinate-nucleotide adenylyltransferase
MGEYKVKKIGVLGGTFDPVHLGHINLALDAAREAGLEKVILVPAKLQPFKLDKKVTQVEDRMNMLELVAEDNPCIEVSDYEMKSESVSYTYLTLREMQRRYGDKASIYFITGTDTMLKIHTWTNADEILSSYSFIVGTRPGYREDELDAAIARLKAKYGCEIIKLHNREFDISATNIRECIMNEESISHLVPQKIERYIKKNGLYH